MHEAMIKRLAWWTGLLIAALLSWQAGKFTWLLWPDEEMVLQSAGQPGGASLQQLKNSYQLWHLFGRKEQAKSQPAQIKQQAPRTRLSLQLMGVVVSDTEEDSGAIIAEQGKSAEYYKVNDTIAAVAKLVNVYTDHVLLSRKGSLEKLSFDDSATDKRTINISETEHAEIAEQTDIETPEQFMDVAQARLNKDPEGALASVGLAPASGGAGPAGYVYDGNNPMLAAMNMQKGDIILSVNGYVLGDMEQDRSKLQEFYESGMLEVVIERAGATFTITYPIP
jgi:general secretion pathway protein C